MQDVSEFSAVPWGRGNAQRIVEFIPADAELIFHGINFILSPGQKPKVLIPLSPTADGVVRYVAMFRNERELNILQFEVGFDEDDVEHRTKKVLVPRSTITMNPHIVFLPTQLDVVDCDRVFWSALRKTWEAAFNALNLNNPQYVMTGGLYVGCFLRQDEWVLPSHNTDPHTLMFGKFMRNRVELSLRVVCGTTSTTINFMVHDSKTKSHFVALIRSGATINMVDVRFIPYPDPIISERRMVFPLDMTQRFPGFQFTSTRLTDAEKDELIQQPVRRYYRTLTDDFFQEQKTRILKLVALAMGLHARIGGGSMIARLHRDVVVMIANKIRVQ
jgi:hypothetical protein